MAKSAGERSHCGTVSTMTSTAITTNSSENPAFT